VGVDVIILAINSTLLTAGLIVFAIGVRKAVRSKYCDLDCIIWCFAGNALIVGAGTLAKFL
jgi:hypothetical protein